MAEWIGDQWRDIGPAAVGLDPSDLERINLDSLEEMVDELGSFNFSKSQAQALIKAAKNAWKESGKDWFVCDCHPGIAAKLRAVAQHLNDVIIDNQLALGLILTVTLCFVSYSLPLFSCKSRLLFWKFNGVARHFLNYAENSYDLCCYSASTHLCC